MKSRSKRILIVDPSTPLAEEFAKSIAHCLRQLFQKYEIKFATTGSEALKVFESYHPDLLLLQTGVKNFSGFQLCKKIRSLEKERHTGIIFYENPAATSADEKLLPSLHAGSDDYFRKNCTPHEIKARLQSVMRVKETNDALRIANHKLQIISLTDDLTGLANMRQFNQKFITALKRCRAGNSGLGVIMMDLDHFKTVNDSANHLVGSYVLAEVGKLLRTEKILEGTDLVARYGGDEFIIFSESDSIEHLTDKAEKIRDALAHKTFEREGHKIEITASLGVGWTKKAFKGKAEDIVKLADLMLYKSKYEGRNCVHYLELRYPIDFDSLIKSHLVKGRQRELALSPTKSPRFQYR